VTPGPGPVRLALRLAAEWQRPTTGTAAGTILVLVANCVQIGCGGLVVALLRLASHIMMMFKSLAACSATGCEHSLALRVRLAASLAFADSDSESEPPP
jgi:hypothetical protein